MPTTGPEPCPPVVLNSRRLLLRPPVQDDIPSIVELINDKAVARMTGYIPFPYERLDAEIWFAKLIPAMEKGEEMAFAIFDAADSALMGVISIENLDPDSPGRGDVGLIGYWLGQKYWNRGFMSEAVAALLQYAFDRLGLAAVEAMAFPDNATSIRILEKSGFTGYGKATVPSPARGGDHDVIVYRIAKKVWTDGNRA